ncbi:hypothetical protein [Streptomyces sp. NPDC005231]|uniref:hypothetical protein n=1 Tax=Streptomyces sp. NPDC005231 TaxID=3157026 RepID=UPI00339DB75D
MRLKLSDRLPQPVGRLEEPFHPPSQELIEELLRIRAVTDLTAINVRWCRVGVQASVDCGDGPIKGLMPFVTPIKPGLRDCRVAG